jgi:hypothetical protein
MSWSKWLATFPLYRKIGNELSLAQLRQHRKDKLIRIHDFLTISTTATDLDEQLDRKLAILDLDLEGELARSMTWQSKYTLMLALFTAEFINSSGIFKLYEPRYTLFMTEWIDSCVSKGSCWYSCFLLSFTSNIPAVNWRLFTQLTSSIIILLNGVTQHASILISKEATEILPPLPDALILDDRSAI